MEQEQKSKAWQEEQALTRFEIIQPLLNEELDPGKKISLRKEIAKAASLSERTIRRYEEGFRTGGFSGLKPGDRKKHRKQDLPEGFDELLNDAIQLKREVPGRSVNQIIFILENEGKVPPGVLKRSTLQRHLYNSGFGRRQMKKYLNGQKHVARRFCKPHRMMLIQADIKYGPVLPIGENGKKKQTYLSSLMDDHSRYILASEFYDNQEAPIVEDTCHKAILKYGTFDSIYCDNGKQYVSKQLITTCAKLGIRVLHAPPYSGQSKGKIEKFHQVVDSFLDEARAKKVSTLEDLNRYWTYYLEEYYQKDPHGGIREYYESHGINVPDGGISPEVEWQRDQRGLVFLNADTVGEAFLHHEDRIVDKGGCVNLNGCKYEVSAALIGAVVEIAYDPVDLDSITVTYPGMASITAKKMVIGAFASKKPEIPASLLPEEPETSRMLDVLEKMHEESVARKADAISFGSYRKDGEK